jgi:hypothetical protein
MDETENKLLKPVQEAINVISTTIEKNDVIEIKDG